MSPVARHRCLWIASAILLAAALAIGARLWLGGYVVRSVLRLAGATQVRFERVSGTPWRLEVANLQFQVKRHPFTARRVVLQREKWWQASLGDVRVEGARAVVVPDGSDVNPWHWVAYESDGGLGEEAVQPPFRSLDLQGELVVRMATLPDMTLDVTLQGTPAGPSAWIGNLLVQGEGLRLAGTGSLTRAGQELDFQVVSAELDLETWARHIQRLVSLPGGTWRMGGRLTGVSEGKVTARRFAATARISLRDGWMQAGTQDIAAQGASAEVEFSDLWKLRSRTGRLQVKSMRVGRLDLGDVEADFGIWNGKQINIDQAQFAALGGRLSTGAFLFHLDQRVVTPVLRVRGISAARLLALTSGLGPRAAGRLDGELPLRIHSGGVHILEGGFLELSPGGTGEIQLNASDFLRSGADLDGATGEAFRRAIGQDAVVRAESLRLDVRPSGLPLGTSARLRVGGRMDENPVSFTYYVNGGVERYLRIMP